MQDPGQTLGLLGAGGQAIEVIDYYEGEVLFFAVEQSFLRVGNFEKYQVNIESPGESILETPVIAAVGGPRLKRELVELWPGTTYGQVIASDATLAQSACLGAGAIVAPGVRIMAKADVGEHVLINTASVVSHECSIGDFSTISPGVTLGGRCLLGQGVFVGIGATVRDGVSIGEGAVIGAGAVVLKDVPPGAVMVGVPAKMLRREPEWLREI